jgi:WW domain
MRTPHNSFRHKERTIQSMSRGTALPKGWEIRIDAVAGNAYFVDTVYGKSHEALPEFTSQLSCESPVAPAGATACQVRVVPIARGKMTQTTPYIPLISVSIPATPTIQCSPPSTSSLDSEDTPTSASTEISPKWSRLIDSATGRPYYVDHASHNSQWEIPQGFVEIKSNNETRLVLRWERRYDVHGNAYFIDHINHTSQWATPEGFLVPATEREGQLPLNGKSAPVCERPASEPATSRRRQRRPPSKHVIKHPVLRKAVRAIIGASVGPIPLLIFDATRGLLNARRALTNEPSP